MTTEERLREALRPFKRTAELIPDSWKGNYPLKNQSNMPPLPTIYEWRKLAEALAAEPEVCEGEHCQVCGATYDNFVYRLPDEIWQLITPSSGVSGSGLLCPNCAIARSEEHGIHLYWSAKDGEFPGCGRPIEVKE